MNPDRVDIPWPIPDRLDLRDALVAVYSAPDRGYHDLLHLTEVVARVVELGSGNNHEVLLAAWFHDAVYDREPEAEERSAALAIDSLAGSSVDVDEVARLVRLTASHRPTPGDSVGEVLTDADLAILAAAPERYASYVSGVRQEYAAYSDADFAAGRIAILTDLLAKPTLFHTPLARSEWEPVARANLAAEIASLQEQL